jgi:hypothetical protein
MHRHTPIGVDPQAAAPDTIIIAGDCRMKAEARGMDAHISDGQTVIEVLTESQRAAVAIASA